MAFHDIEKLFYDGTIKLRYMDKAHRYFRLNQEQWGGSTEPKWGKQVSVKGVTTIMDAVLEKKGLMTWPMGLALRELFGFYDFTNESGEHLSGFSKGVGSLWGGAMSGDGIPAQDALRIVGKDELLPLVQSASKAWQRKKKSGADVGSLVHDAIEQFTKGTPFDLTLEKYAEGLEEGFDETQALEELRMAQMAYDRFKVWWNETKPKLIGSEELVYSRELDVAGTFDCILEIDGKIVLGDYKTSAASTNKDAAAPEGVYYSYLIQLGFYALAWEEMGGQKLDDLVTISCRKDGNFSIVYASELGLSVNTCKEWAKAVWACHGFMAITKKALWAHAEKKDE